MTAPTIVEGELFDEPNPNTGGIPLYKQWLYVLLPIAFALFVWIFGETIQNWWISTVYFSSPKTYKVNRHIHSSETVRDAISL